MEKMYFKVKKNPMSSNRYGMVKFDSISTGGKQ